jgi:hypothetical protein
MSIAPVKFSGIVIAIRPQSGPGKGKFDEALSTIQEMTESPMASGSDTPPLQGVQLKRNVLGRSAVIGTPHFTEGQEAQPGLDNDNKANLVVDTLRLNSIPALVLPGFFLSEQAMVDGMAQTEHYLQLRSRGLNLNVLSEAPVF